MNWELAWGGKLYEFAGPSLLELCTMDISRYEDQDEVYALKNLVPQYKALMIAIFRQALYDYLILGMRGESKNSNQKAAASAKTYIEGLEDLAFLGLPKMSGKDILQKIEGDWNTFYRTSMAVRCFESSTRQCYDLGVRKRVIPKKESKAFRENYENNLIGYLERWCREC